MMISCGAWGTYIIYWVSCFWKSTYLPAYLRQPWIHIISTREVLINQSLWRLSSFPNHALCINNVDSFTLIIVLQCSTNHTAIVCLQLSRINFLTWNKISSWRKLWIAFQPDSHTNWYVLFFISTWCLPSSNVDSVLPVSRHCQFAAVSLWSTQLLQCCY